MSKFTKTSVVGHILEQFLKPQFKYKGIPVNIFGLPTFRANYLKKNYRFY